MNLLKLAIEKGRICQWLVICSCFIVCLSGGILGFLDKPQIVEIMRYSVITAGGIEVMKQLLTRGTGE